MNKRSNMLDILKGLMIIFIIITHFKFEYPTDYKKFGFYFYIDMAVPVFMIVTGFLSARQFSKKKIDKYEKAWSKDIVIPKVLRFGIPFFVAFLVEVPFLLVVRKFGIIELIQTFLRGGAGPGSYYTPIMFQLIFIFPIIYFIVKKYDFFGTILCFIITALWEMIQFSWGMDRFSYALLVFRYISMIGFGCYIAIGQKELNKVILGSMFFLGIVWQTLLNYIPLHPIFMNYEWARVNYLPSLFVMPIIYELIKRFSDSNIKCTPIQEFGKASFNIYLVQMVFYGCGAANIIYKYITQTWVQLLICLFVNLLVGYIFYRIENKVTNEIIIRVRERNYYSDVMLRISDRCNSLASK